MGAVYSKTELVALIRLNAMDPERVKQTGITPADRKVLEGALTYRDRPVSEIMTPIAKTFAISIETVLDKATFKQLLQKGHTRVPVYEERQENIIGLLYCKDLLAMGFERQMSVREVLKAFNAERRVLRISSWTKAGDAFEICKKRRQHMLIVTDERPSLPLPQSMEKSPKKKMSKESSRSLSCHILTELFPAVGVITMEDIIEEIIQEEIVGEDDELDDTLNSNTVRGDPLQLLTQVSREDSDMKLPGSVIE